MIKNYEIVTRTYFGRQLGSSFTFLTNAINIKTALHKLLTKSQDFRYIVDKDEKKIRITIEEIK